MKIKWDQVGERTYETGCDHGVLYKQMNGAYPKGVAWNGLTNVTESPSGAEPTALYADNMKYLNLMSAEEYGATIECYTYPEEWSECNGEAEIATGVTIGQQTRKNFGFSYRSKIGSDTEGEDYGYKIHLIYNGLASPSEQSHGTVNDSPEAVTFSYTVTTTAIPVDGKTADGKEYKATACVTIDSTKVDAEKLAALEKILYGEDGEDGADPRLPLPNEIMQIFAAG